jgi:kynurenine formamidase
MNKLIDLTHTLSPEIPSWDGDSCCKITIAFDYKDGTPPNLFRVQKIEGKLGMGTHIDAPAHCFEGKETVDLLKLENLVVDCVVINVVSIAHENYLVMPDILELFEKEYGILKPNTFVIFYTGWSEQWNTPEKYRNNLHFPSIHPDTAKILIEKNIAGIGIDTLSPDAVGDDFPVHRIILGAGKFIVENVANIKELPPTGAKVTILPLKVDGGTEAPVRMIAMV